MRDFSENSGIDRRSLLAGAGAALAASAVGASPALGHGRGRKGHGDHGGRGSIPRESISIQLYTLRSLPLEEQLKGLAEIGYKTVEHAGFGGRTAAQFKAALRKYGPAGHIGPSGHPAAVRRGRVAQAGRRRASRSGSATSSTRRARSRSSRPTATSSKIKGLTTVAAWKAYAADLNKAGAIGAPGRPAVRLPQPLLGVARRSRTTRR